MEKVIVSGSSVATFLIVSASKKFKGNLVGNVTGTSSGWEQFDS